MKEQFRVRYGWIYMALGAQTRDVWQHVLPSCTYVDHVGYSLFVYRIGNEK